MPPKGAVTATVGLATVLMLAAVIHDVWSTLDVPGATFEFGLYDDLDCGGIPECKSYKEGRNFTTATSIMALLALILAMIVMGLRAIGKGPDRVHWAVILVFTSMVNCILAVAVWAENSHGELPSDAELGPSWVLTLIVMFLTFAAGFLGRHIDNEDGAAADNII